MGGAKAGLCVDVNTMQADRPGVMGAFGRAIAGLIRDRVFLPGVDLGTTLDDLRMIMAAAEQPLAEDQIDGSAATAFTVFECIRQAVQFAGADLAGMRSRAGGVGKVGSVVAQLLQQAGARLTVVSTVEGAVAKETGLDVSRLLELRETYADALVDHVEGAARLEAEDLPRAFVDVLIPGARPWLIHAGNVDGIRARWVVPIANAPITPEAEARLCVRGVSVIPDFVANCGGIFASDLHSHGFSLAEGRSMIEGAYAASSGPCFRPLPAMAVPSGRRRGRWLGDGILRCHSPLRGLSPGPSACGKCCARRAPTVSGAGSRARAYRRDPGARESREGSRCGSDGGHASGRHSACIGGYRLDGELGLSMSGVFGVAERGTSNEVGALVGRMATSLAYLPWVVTRAAVDPQGGVAIGQAGIGLLNPGPQPIWNPDRSVALAMAGEFTPSPEGIRQQSDEAFALASYERHGVTFARHLAGAFVVAVWDRARGRLLLTNDRFGLYNLFFAKHRARPALLPRGEGDPMRSYLSARAGPHRLGAVHAVPDAPGDQDFPGGYPPPATGQRADVRTFRGPSGF